MGTGINFSASQPVGIYVRVISFLAMIGDNNRPIKKNGQVRPANIL